MRFAEKSVVVFGGASGIGQRACEAFAREGASVVVADLDAGAAEDVARSIEEAGGKAIAAHADVTSYPDVEAAVDLAVSRYNSIDVVFNSAGVLGRRPLLEHEPQDFARIININLQGTYHGILAGARAMRERRIQGCIINTASVAAYMSTPGMIGYHASKGGVRSLTQAAALELAPLGIRVVGVAPGIVDTPLIDDAKAVGVERDMARRQMRRKLIGADKVAEVVMFLASPEADAINGTTVLVDDGYVGFK